MEILKEQARAIEQAMTVLRAGGVILYPTDTLYGLGADAFSDVAVDKIYAIKGRDPMKPIHAVFADLAMIEKYAEVNEVARTLIARFLPGALTLVLKKRPEIQNGIARDIDTIGVRIPNNEVCLKIANGFGSPFTTTSANGAGLPAQKNVQDILLQLGKNADLIDLAIDAGTLSGKLPSTVIDVSRGHIEILREGAISREELLQVIKF